MDFFGKSKWFKYEPEFIKVDKQAPRLITVVVLRRFRAWQANQLDSTRSPIETDDISLGNWDICVCVYR